MADIAHKKPKRKPEQVIVFKEVKLSRANSEDIDADVLNMKRDNTGKAQPKKLRVQAQGDAQVISKPVVCNAVTQSCPNYGNSI